MTSPEIPDSASPYWLRLYGRWVHLQGIMPVRDIQPGREFSGLLTVDGYRFVHAAPRGPRTWGLDYRYGTAAATAALESAAYTYNHNDPLTRTLFMDRNLAKTNMVDPDLSTAWTDPVPQFIMNVGESPEQPIWLPSYRIGAAGVAPQTFINRAYFALIPGVTYTAAVWTQVSVGFKVLRVANTAGNVTLGEYTSVGGGTSASPELATVTFVAPDNVPAGETIVLEMSGSQYSAGLMLYEGDCPPTYYRAGRRMPCEVSVQDPTITNNLIWRYCDPCLLPREHATFVVQEVGTSATSGLVGL